MLTPKNTQYNRRHQIVDKPGKIFAVRNGIVYFSFDTGKDGVKCFKCEMEFFERQFDADAEEFENTLSSNDEIEKLVKSCLRYP